MASYWCSPSPRMGCFVPDLSSAQTNGAAAAAAPAARKLRRVVDMDIDRCSLYANVGAGPKPGAQAGTPAPQYFYFAALATVPCGSMTNFLAAPLSKSL